MWKLCRVCLRKKSRSVKRSTSCFRKFKGSSIRLVPRFPTFPSFNWCSKAKNGSKRFGNKRKTLNESQSEIPQPARGNYFHSFSSFRDRQDNARERFTSDFSGNRPLCLIDHAGPSRGRGPRPRLLFR